MFAELTRRLEPWALRRQRLLRRHTPEMRGRRTVTALRVIVERGSGRCQLSADEVAAIDAWRNRLAADPISVAFL